MAYAQNSFHRPLPIDPFAEPNPQSLLFFFFKESAAPQILPSSPTRPPSDPSPGFFPLGIPPSCPLPQPVFYLKIIPQPLASRQAQPHPHAGGEPIGHGHFQILDSRPC